MRLVKALTQATAVKWLSLFPKLASCRLVIHTNALRHQLHAHHMTPGIIATTAAAATAQPLGGQPTTPRPRLIPLCAATALDPATYCTTPARTVLPLPLSPPTLALHELSPNMHASSADNEHAQRNCRQQASKHAVTLTTTAAAAATAALQGDNCNAHTDTALGEQCVINRRPLVP